MSDTSTNGAVHPPVQRVRARARQREDGMRDREAEPMTSGANGTCDAADATPVPGDSGRDKNGRFVRGNAGGPGNPFARRVAQLRRTLCETVTEEDMQAVAKKLVEQARQGDVAAARLLLSYTVGQPAPAVDPDTLDLAEWDIHRRTPINVDEMCQFMSGIPTALICKIAGALTPFLQARAAEAMHEVLTADPADLAAAMERAAQIMGCEAPDDWGRDVPVDLVGEPSANQSTANGSAAPPDCPICGHGTAVNGGMEPLVCPICGPNGPQERDREPAERPAPAAPRQRGKASNRKHAGKTQPAAPSARRRKEAPPSRAPSTNRANGAGGRRPAPA